MRRSSIWLLPFAALLLMNCSLLEQAATEASPTASSTSTALHNPPATYTPSFTAFWQPQSTPTWIDPDDNPDSIHQNNPRPYRVDLSVNVANHGYALERIILYLAKPGRWTGQDNVLIEAVQPEPSKDYTEPEYGNHIYYWESRNAPRNGDEILFQLRFSYTATEINTDVVESRIQPYRKNDPLYKLYTRPERFLESSDSTIREKARSIAASETSPYRIARRIYDFVVFNLTYAQQDGLIGAKAALAKKAGECGDYSSLFIALARANGIPARPVVGFWANTGPGQYHVWAEFYLEGVGWIPVDPTVGQNENRDYYFGNMDNRRVIMHKGFNLRVSPTAPDGRPIPLIQSPWYWYWGSGNADLLTVSEINWLVSELN